MDLPKKLESMLLLLRVVIADDHELPLSSSYTVRIEVEALQDTDDYFFDAEALLKAREEKGKVKQNEMPPFMEISDLDKNKNRFLVSFDRPVGLNLLALN